MLKTLPAVAAIAAASMLVIPTISNAAETDSVRVSYADLNLISKFDQAKLQHRIASAAETVCGAADHRDVALGQAIGKCRKATIADAQPAFQSAVAASRHPSVTVLEATALVVTAH
jgi:UrcA family protein